MDIKTDLKASDSWNPAIRFYRNVADLAIVARGKLECRFVLPEQDKIELPPEVFEDRNIKVIKYHCSQIHYTDSSSTDNMLGTIVQRNARNVTVLSQYGGKVG